MYKRQGVGDAIVFAEQDDLGNATATTYSVPVAGIIENYIGDYAFMTPETYERTFGEEADNLTVYARATTDEGERQAPVSYTHLDVYKRQLVKLVECPQDKN